MRVLCTCAVALATSACCALLAVSLVGALAAGAQAQHDAVDASVQEEEETDARCCQVASVAADARGEHVVFVSTMDGYMHALDSNNGGALLWSLPTGTDALLAGTLGQLHLSTGGHDYRLIPTLDGHLYVYGAGNSLHPLPFDIETLLTTSSRFGTDVVAGGKEVLTHGVSLLSGELKYTCDAFGCERNAAAAGAHSGPTVVVRRISQTVRAVHAISGEERWNVTVAEHQMHLADETLASSIEQEASERLKIQVRPSAGAVMAFDAGDKLLWTRRLGQPIAQGWQWLEAANVLDQLSIFDADIVPPLDHLADDEYVQLESLMYLGSYKGDAYIVLSEGERARLRNLVATKRLSGPAVTFQTAPPIESDGSDEHALAPFYDERLSLNAHSDVVGFLNTVELLGEAPTPCEQTDSCGGGQSRSCAPNEAGSLSSAEVDDSQALGWYLYQHRHKRSSAAAELAFSRWPRMPHYLTPRGIRGAIKAKGTAALEKGQRDPDEFWWLLSLCVISLCFVSAITSAACMRCYQKRQYKERLRQISEISTLDRSSTSRRSSSAQQVDTADVRTVMSQASFPNSQASSNDMADYDSRFMSDFEAVRCLGRGGFGVVFQCRNRYDECDYAIKRTTVPNSATSREKVMREVRALARLDHSRIVRYYNCWLETPPKRWQDECDAKLMAMCAANRHELSGATSGEHLAGTSAYTSTSGPAAPVLRQRTAAKAQRGTASTLDVDSLRPARFAAGTGESYPLRGDQSDSVVFANSTADGRQGKSATAADASETERSVGADANGADANGELRSVQVQATSQSQVMYLYIQMQLCSARTLSHWLRSRGASDDRCQVRGALLCWFRQACQAVAYVHSMGLMHRDLKPSNIFFEYNGRGVRVGDFGLATTWQQNDCDQCVEVHTAEVDEGGDRNSASASGSSQLTDNVGTRLYMSPELLRNAPYTNKVDVYSLGLILAELLAGFGTHMERVRSLEAIRRHKAQDGALHHVKTALGDDWSHVSWLTNGEPCDRPACDEILACDALFDNVDEQLADRLGHEFVSGHPQCGQLPRKTF